MWRGVLKLIGKLMAFVYTYKDLFDELWKCITAIGSKFKTWFCSSKKAEETNVVEEAVAEEAVTEGTLTEETVKEDK